MSRTDKAVLVALAVVLALVVWWLFDYHASNRPAVLFGGGLQSENILWVASALSIVGGVGLVIYARITTGRWW